MSLLLSSVQILDFLSFHPLFGPWAVIIAKLLVDLGRFLVVLFIFLLGFSMFVSAIYVPIRPIYTDLNLTKKVGTGYPPTGKCRNLFYFILSILYLGITQNISASI